MTDLFRAWMWAHPDLFVVVFCGSFAACSVALFLCVKKLVGGPTDE